MLQGNFKGVLSVFQGLLENVSLVFHVCYKDVSRMFYGSCKVGKFQGCFKAINFRFKKKKSFKGVSTVF